MLLDSPPPTYSASSPALIIMSKTQFYLSNCAHAAKKSDMQFMLGAVLVKRGENIVHGLQSSSVSVCPCRIHAPSVELAQGAQLPLRIS